MIESRTSNCPTSPARIENERPQLFFEGFSFLSFFFVSTTTSRKGPKFDNLLRFFFFFFLIFLILELIRTFLIPVGEK